MADQLTFYFFYKLIMTFLQIISFIYYIVIINIYVMNNKITLGYWGIRGLGQVPRLLLAYTGAIWEDVKYTAPEQWFGGDKDSLGLQFPNLPYIIDGDFKITESRAIIFYIVKKSGREQLLGKDIKDQARVECLNGVLQDIRTNLGPLFWDKDWQSKSKAAIQKVTPKLQQIQNLYGEKDFALGYLTVSDFQFSELSYFVQKIAPEQYSKYPFLARVRKAFENLPEIKKYYQQESSVKGPFLPPTAAISI